jgi:hypothetical protein
MDFTQQMYGIFNVETKELLRGPFKSKRGAANSRAAVIDTLLQRYYLADDKDYYLYLSWHRGIEKSHLLKRYSQPEVDHIFEKFEEFSKAVQVRPVVVTMGEID